MLLRWKDGARTEAAQLLATQSAKLASVDRSDDLSKSAGHPKLRNSRLLGLHQIPAQSRFSPQAGPPKPCGGLRAVPYGDLENTAADTLERLCIFEHPAELDQLQLVPDQFCARSGNARMFLLAFPSH